MAFAAVMLAISLASTAYEGYSAYKTNEAQQDAIEQQSNAAQLQAQQESLQRANKIQQVLSAQTNQAAASGVAAGSPSLSTIQTESINQFSRDQRAANLTSALQKEYFKDYSKAATGQMYSKEANIFGSSVVGAMEGYQANKFYESQKPKTSPSGDKTGSFL